MQIPFPSLDFFHFPPTYVRYAELAPLILIFGLQPFVKGREIDIIHAHSPFFADKFALRVTREKHIPIIATFYSKQR